MRSSMDYKVAFVGALLVGCGPSNQQSADGGARSDAAAVVVDAATVGSDAATVTVDAASSSTPLTRCQQLARNAQENCAESNGADDVRVCLWRSYESLCETGDEARLTSAIECLSQTACRTFSDANDGRACLQAQNTASGPRWAAYQAVTETCGSTATADSFAESEVFAYLTDADAALLDSCVHTTPCSLESIFADCASSIPALAPFATCE